MRLRLRCERDATAGRPTVPHGVEQVTETTAEAPSRTAIAHGVV